MSDKQRLFFALWPEEPVQAAAAAAGRKIAEERGIRGRIMAATRIHLTLLFLGDVAASAVDALREAAATVNTPAFDLALSRAGSFHRSRVLWLGPDPTPPELLALWLQLRTRVQHLRLPHDTLALSAHVTCLRDIERAIKLTPIDPIAWPVRDFVLVHSVLGQEPHYRIVARFPLAADVKAGQARPARQ